MLRLYQSIYLNTDKQLTLGSQLFLIMDTQFDVLARPYALHKAIITCLNQLINANPCKQGAESVFDIKSAPNITISEYLARMFRYMNCSVSTFVYSLILIDRVLQYNPNFTIHELSNVLAVKCLDDLYYKNSYYANVGGISLGLLNQLQIEFLQMINFNCSVQAETFNAYLERLEACIEINEEDKVKDKQWKDYAQKKSTNHTVKIGKEIGKSETENKVNQQNLG